MGRVRTGNPIGRPKNAAKWEEIKRLRESGMSKASIARIVGLHSTTVIYVLQRLGDPYSPSKNPRRKLRGPTLSIMAKCRRRNLKWKRLYEEERWTVVEIGNAYKRHFATVSRGLKAVGTQMRTSSQSAVRSGRRTISNHVEIMSNRLKSAEKADRVERMMQIVTRKKGWAA